MTAYQEAILAHYVSQWRTEPAVLQPRKAPVYQVRSDFKVLEFAPSETRNMWTYATCGMSAIESARLTELHIFSATQSVGIADLLAAVAYYHQTEQPLDLAHTVNFGIGWQDESACTYGLISLPYLDGPALEKMQYRQQEVGFYWLLPITKSEREFKRNHGLEALEELFDAQGVDYIDAHRKPVA